MPEQKVGEWTRTFDEHGNLYWWKPGAFITELNLVWAYNYNEYWNEIYIRPDIRDDGPQRPLFPIRRVYNNVRIQREDLEQSNVRLYDVVREEILRGEGMERPQTRADS